MIYPTRQPIAPYRLNWNAPLVHGLVTWLPLIDYSPIDRVHNLAFTQSATKPLLSGNGPSRAFVNASSTTLTAAAPLTGVPLTIACWYNANSTSARSFVSLNAVANVTNFFNLGILSTLPSLRAQSGDGTTSSATGTVAISAKRWTLAVGVWLATNSRSVFTDGINKITQTSTRTPVGIDTLTIGALGGSTPSVWFDGNLSNVCIWNRALSDAEVWSLYDPLTRWQLYDVSRLFIIGGISTAVTGAANITLGALTVASVGTVAVKGTANITLGALTVASVGTVAVTGAANLTLSALTVNAAGTVAVRGAASITLGALTVAAAGVAPITGAASITLGALAITAAGAVAVTGAANITLAALAVTATGVVGAAPAIGTANLTLGALVIASAGVVAVRGVANLALSALAVGAVGAVAVTGAANITLGTLTVNAAGVVSVRGAADITLGALVIVADGSITATVIVALVYGSIRGAGGVGVVRGVASVGAARGVASIGAARGVASVGVIRGVNSVGSVGG